MLRPNVAVSTDETADTDDRIAIENGIIAIDPLFQGRHPGVQ
jgi:hypothetical protein